MEWMLLGWGLVFIYWWFAYKLTYHQRVGIVSQFFVIVLVISALGILYEIITMGTIGAPYP